MILNIQEHRIIFIFNQGKEICRHLSMRDNRSNLSAKDEDKKKENDIDMFRSDVALIYNDRSVLENHHVSAAFRLMRIDDYNIISEFSSDEYKYVENSFCYCFFFRNDFLSSIEIFDIWLSKWF